MKSKNEFNLMLNLPENVFLKTIKGLHKAGMSVNQIARTLQVSVSYVAEPLNIKIEDRDKSFYPYNESLVNEILYDANVPIAKEEIVRIEKERYVRYAQVEEKSLEIMVKLLSYYSKQPIGVDLKEDRFKAELASNFIKATQQCREEILKKYEIETRKSSEDNKILVEFVDPISVNNK